MTLPPPPHAGAADSHHTSETTPTRAVSKCVGAAASEPHASRAASVSAVSVSAARPTSHACGLGLGPGACACAYAPAFCTVPRAASQPSRVTPVCGVGVGVAAAATAGGSGLGGPGSATNPDSSESAYATCDTAPAVLTPTFGTVPRPTLLDDVSRIDHATRLPTSLPPRLPAANPFLSSPPTTTTTIVVVPVLSTTTTTTSTMLTPPPPPQQQQQETTSQHSRIVTHSTTQHQSANRASYSVPTTTTNASEDNIPNKLAKTTPSVKVVVPTRPRVVPCNGANSLAINTNVATPTTAEVSSSLVFSPSVASLIAPAAEKMSSGIDKSTVDQLCLSPDSSSLPVPESVDRLSSISETIPNSAMQTDNAETAVYSAIPAINTVDSNHKPFIAIKSPENDDNDINLVSSNHDVNNDSQHDSCANSSTSATKVSSAAIDTAIQNSPSTNKYDATSTNARIVENGVENDVEHGLLSPPLNGHNNDDNDDDVSGESSSNDSEALTADASTPITATLAESGLVHTVSSTFYSSSSSSMSPTSAAFGAIPHDVSDTISKSCPRNGGEYRGGSNRSVSPSSKLPPIVPDVAPLPAISKPPSLSVPAMSDRSSSQTSTGSGSSSVWLSRKVKSISCKLRGFSKKSEHLTALQTSSSSPSPSSLASTNVKSATLSSSSDAHSPLVMISRSQSAEPASCEKTSCTGGSHGSGTRFFSKKSKPTLHIEKDHIDTANKLGVESMLSNGNNPVTTSSDSALQNTIQIGVATPPSRQSASTTTTMPLSSALRPPSSFGKSTSFKSSIEGYFSRGKPMSKKHVTFSVEDELIGYSGGDENATSGWIENCYGYELDDDDDERQFLADMEEAMIRSSDDVAPIHNRFNLSPADQNYSSTDSCEEVPEISINPPPRTLGQGSDVVAASSWSPIKFTLPSDASPQNENGRPGLSHSPPAVQLWNQRVTGTNDFEQTETDSTALVTQEHVIAWIDEHYDYKLTEFGRMLSAFISGYKPEGQHLLPTAYEFNDIKRICAIDVDCLVGLFTNPGIVVRKVGFIRTTLLPLQIADIFGSLLHQRSLRRLTLDGVCKSRDGLKYVCEFVFRMKSLRTLRICDWLLDSVATQWISKALETSHIINLSVDRCKISTVAFGELALGLLRSSVECLSLVDVGLKPDAAYDLAMLLDCTATQKNSTDSSTEWSHLGNSNLKELNVDGNELASSLSILSRALSTNNKLRSFRMRRIGCISSNDFLNLIVTLWGNETLNTLDIGENKILDDVPQVSSTTSATSVSTSTENQKLSEEIVNALCELLRSNSNIEVLSVSSIGLYDDCSDSLGHALLMNKALRKFNISRNYLTQAGIDSMCEIVRDRPTPVALFVHPMRSTV